MYIQPHALLQVVCPNLTLHHHYAYMDPSERDEVIFVLSVKEFFLVGGFTRVRLTLLFWYDDVRHSKHILGLCV